MTRPPDRPLLLRAASAGLAVAALTACSADEPAAAPVRAGVAAPPPATSPVTSPDAGATTPARTQVDVGAELEVDDQSGDGRTVRVEQARLSDGTGHVALLDRDGRLLGSVPVPRGDRAVTVRLREPLRASAELVAVLHADDGDGRFERERDAVVVDDDGEREEDDLDYRTG